jgi:hypothetical protein
MHARSLRLTFNMERVLTLIKTGQPVATGCAHMGDYGGLDGTLRGLMRRKLIDKDHNLTVRGEHAAKAVQ